MDLLASLVGALLAALLGALAGTGTGLLPGLHVNTLALLLTTLPGVLLGVDALPLAAFAAAAAVAHSFASAVPAVFLGAPEGDTALSVLPGHRLLLRGRGYEAVVLTAWGSLLAVLLGLALLLPFRLLVGDPVDAAGHLDAFVAVVLLAISAFLVLTERGKEGPSWRRRLVCLTPDGILRRDVEDAVPVDRLDPHSPAATVRGIVREADARSCVLESGGRTVRIDCEFTPEVEPSERLAVRAVASRTVRRGAAVQRTLAAAVFLLAGLLGVIVLHAPGLWSGGPLGPALAARSALLPLFSGLFGLSTLLVSRGTGVRIPPQSLDVRPLPRRSLRGLLAGTVAGGSVALLPGVSSGAATIVAARVNGEEGGEEAAREFLFAAAVVNTAVALFSLTVLFITARVRSGAAAAIAAVAAPVRPWLPADNPPVLFTGLLLAVLVAAAVAFALTIRAGRVFARHAARVPIRTLTDGVIALLVALTVAFTGPVGLVVLLTATGIGLLPPLLGLKRVHLMGCLVVPILLVVV